MDKIDIRDGELYADWSYEDLGEHIKMLRELQEQKAGYDLPKQKLSEMLDPTNPNFLGTGQTLAEFMTSLDLRRMAFAFFRQDRREKNRRMQYVTGLAKILASIEAISISGTGLARGAIEEVFDGDWPRVREWARDFQKDPHYFGGGGPDLEPLWQQFGALLQEAFDTRPNAPTPPQPKN